MSPAPFTPNKGQWSHVRKHGLVRLAGLGAAALSVSGVLLLLISAEPVLVLASTAALILGLAAGRYAVRVRVEWPKAPRPAHPVLLWNPRSGGGKAARAHLCDEALARGIEPIEITPGIDLERLVRDALDRGADALAIAGGDGSQATVARIAAEQNVPFACIPAGTRNHFALDLGVDRDDLVGALDAFVDGGERRVDLGEVNGRTFVNNVSLGLYGEAVQRAGYRDAKVRTLLETATQLLEPTQSNPMRWHTPDGAEEQGAVVIVVSNNRYRLGHVLGDGTRPRLDEGLLGVAVLDEPGRDARARTWAAPSFEVQAGGPLHAGIDGEAVVLSGPLRFRIRPKALRCRIARQHPGVSPSAFAPETPWALLGALVGIAAGREPRPLVHA
jgi:diacylglycerol kinase family enzyme